MWRGEVVAGQPQHPPAATAAYIAAPRHVGPGELEIADLILAVALFAWANQLMHTLGEPTRES